MNRSTTHRVGWVEVLENRRLLSASTSALSLDFASVQTGFVVQPQTASPSVVGTFTGTATNSDVKGTGSVTFVIQTQTSRGTISGTVTDKYPGSHSHTYSFTGKIRGDSITMDINDGTVATGTASNNGHVLSGTHKNSKDGSTGTFDVSRPKHR